MREILIFLLISLVITDDAANILIAKSTIDAGLGAIRQFVPGGQVIAGFLAIRCNKTICSWRPSNCWIFSDFF